LTALAGGVAAAAMSGVGLRVDALPVAVFEGCFAADAAFARDTGAGAASRGSAGLVAVAAVAAVALGVDARSSAVGEVVAAVGGAVSIAADLVGRARSTALAAVCCIGEQVHAVPSTNVVAGIAPHAARAPDAARGSVTRRGGTR